MWHCSKEFHNRHDTSSINQAQLISFRQHSNNSKWQLNWFVSSWTIKTNNSSLSRCRWLQWFKTEHMLYTVFLQIISLFSPLQATKPALTLPKFLFCNFMKSFLWIFNTTQYFYIVSERKLISFSCPQSTGRLRSRVQI